MSVENIIPYYTSHTHFNNEAAVLTYYTYSSYRTYSSFTYNENEKHYLLRPKLLKI